MRKEENFNPQKGKSVPFLYFQSFKKPIEYHLDSRFFKKQTLKSLKDWR